MLAGLALAVGGGLAAAPSAAPAPTAAPTAAPGAARLPQLKHSAEDPGDWIDIEITEAVLERLAEAPGAAADDGFVARLEGGEVLEIEVSDALEGDLLVLETELREAAAGGPAARRFALSLYILPAGQAVPAVLPTGREDDLMAAYGLVRIGRLDLGAVRFWPDPGSGEEVILEDTRQAELPGIAANRPVRVAGAVFV
jgi:hypothetical protein